MELFNRIQQKSKMFYFRLFVLSIFNSILFTGLLLFINHAITQTPLPYFARYDWLVFVVMIVFSLLVNKVFQTYLIRLTNDIRFDFEVDILEKLRFASYRSFETLGNERVFTAIQDTRTLGNVPEVFMSALNSLIIILCCFGYLFWISWAGGLLLLLLMGSLFAFYILRNEKIEKKLNVLRDLHNSYYRYLSDLLYGFKELKMSLKRSDKIYTHFLRSNRSAAKKIAFDTSSGYLVNELIGSYSWYIVLGVIMFALPNLFQLQRDQLIAYIVTILYLIGPVAVLVTLIPTYTNVKIAVERLVEFDRKVNFQADAETSAGALALPDALGGRFESIRFDNVSFEYFDEHQQKTFNLGPINLHLGQGEVVYVIGGNGSGKSTFVNLLTGLYVPTEGSIYYNNQKITAGNYAAYRDKMSVIFTNNHLFSENYNDYELNQGNARLKEYIELVQLTDVLKIDDEKNNIDTRLSKGQQKRLALVYAMLEDKDIFIFDEWAAEQDPRFRAYFYKVVLPRLKAAGKTVIAVTHDDDFYAHADRVIKFGYGKVVQDQEAGVVDAHVVPAPGR